MWCDWKLWWLIPSLQLVKPFSSVLGYLGFMEINSRSTLWNVPSTEINVCSNHGLSTIFSDHFQPLIKKSQSRHVQNNFLTWREVNSTIEEEQGIYTPLYSIPISSNMAMENPLSLYKWISTWSLHLYRGCSIIMVWWRVIPFMTVTNP